MEKSVDGPAAATANGAAAMGTKMDKKQKKLMSGLPAGARSITLDQIQKDRLTQTAAVNWSTQVVSRADRPAFNPGLVKQIYDDELVSKTRRTVPLQRVMLLEISQYLENYLWPNFDPEAASFEHVMSVIVMVNEKFRENVPAWRSFHQREDVFPLFFRQVLGLKEGERQMTIQERTNYLLFLINCFQSLEDEMVQRPVLKLVSLPLWHALSPGRRQAQFKSYEKMGELWERLQRREAKEAKKGGDPLSKPEVQFMPGMLHEFLQTLETVISTAEAKTDGDEPMTEAGAASADGPEGAEAPVAGQVDTSKLLYCERFVEFLIDLLSQLPTRRFLHAVVEDFQIVVKCRMSTLFSHPRGRLFTQLVDLLKFYMTFEINNHTGHQLEEDEIQEAHCRRLYDLQLLCFQQWPQLRPLALSHVGAIERRDQLAKFLAVLSDEELRTLVTEHLKLVSPDDPWIHRPGFLLEVVLQNFERRPSQREFVNELPLYPNEDVLWDENLVPSINYTGEGCLALPKLNLQFLTFHDYLLRNFNLFRLESTYEIREDLGDVLQRVKAGRNRDEEVVFGGWARMAMPTKGFRVTEVRAPNIGEVKPARVLAEVKITVAGLKDVVRAEWNDIKEHDVLFLLSIQPAVANEGEENGAKEGGERKSVPERFGLKSVRGAEVVEMRDENGTLMNDFSGRTKREDVKPPEGNERTILLALDQAQYQLDVTATAERGAPDVYAGFNLLVRRKPKENNFKAILECIRDLMNENNIVPEWLREIFLGYGDPAAAQYQNLPEKEQLRTIDFKDTFLSADHLRESFPGSDVRFVGQDNEADAEPKPPFRVTFPPRKEESSTPVIKPPAKRKGVDGEVANGGSAMEVDGAKQPEAEPILAQSYVPPDPGPYPQNQPRQNSVRFTPVQVEAIKSGVNPGLTMVVGPPGTGKTDTAVQILNVLYHNCPGQRTLLITHSNQALNDLFEKIMQRDVPARYLLRLGMGEKELESEQNFSRQGRVNAMLARRIELLAEVERLARTLDVPADVAYTCESAAHFWLLHVLARWEEFSAACEASQEPSIVKEKFPFKEYFSDVGRSLFSGVSYARDMRAATGCWRHLRTMFQELEECRAFELLKTTADRSNYLMTKQAKIIAMTCTHAALKRHDFLDLGLKYDNLVMEESAQILEIETFIPMLLQRQDDNIARLKRVILIGDHHQLPPVVKNMAFQKYSHMDQSLFTRFVRLGTPYVELNAQGRARPSIARLYNWRYRQLGDLPAVQQRPEFQVANAGFTHEFQFIDVPDHQGRGEFEPNPHFFQNLGEAEYVVSVYQYMRMLGYPAHKISILSTYNGQKHLIRDVIERRCANHPLFGRPSKVTTVDRFQGQQNDYILLSLVRTRVVGHLRDVRRLVVAMSRARLGLYVFGRRALFEQCYELQPTFQTLLHKPDRLELNLDEKRTPTQRRAGDASSSYQVSGLDEMAQLVNHRYEDWVREQQVEAQRRQVAGSQVAAALAFAASKGYAPGRGMGVPTGPSREEDLGKTKIMSKKMEA